MSFACPHCTKPIEDVVPRARLDEKTSAIKNQDAKLTALEEQLKAMENVKAEAAQVARLRDELALSRAGIQDERQARRVLGAWKADSEGAEKPPGLTDWMKADGADIVGAFRAAPAPSAPADPAAPAAPAVPAAPGQAAPAAAPAAAPLPTGNADPAAAPAPNTPPSAKPLVSRPTLPTVPGVMPVPPIIAPVSPPGVPVAADRSYPAPGVAVIPPPTGAVAPAPAATPAPATPAAPRPAPVSATGGIIGGAVVGKFSARPV